MVVSFTIFNSVVAELSEKELSNLLIRKIQDSETNIESKIDENESHHKFANDKIITTIEDIEKGINTEIKSVNKEISTENVATRQLIRQKAKKQE